MKLYTVITENDESEWNDKTGVRYHFPKKYSSHLIPGVRVIYYKGRMRKGTYQAKRLSKSTHYFGTALISQVYPDKESVKGDQYADLIEFEQFLEPVLASKDGDYFEEVSRKNYWRDAVRPISEKIYQSIVSQANLVDVSEEAYPTQDAFYELTYNEGGKVLVYTTKYERNKKIRTAVIKIHGTTCMICEFNFQKIYGKLGKGFIHVHHLKPISSYIDKHTVNAKTDFAVLCPNCHAMVHRKKNNVLELEDLKKLIH
jgi:putative restriction endonuclease